MGFFDRLKRRLPIGGSAAQTTRPSYTPPRPPAREEEEEEAKSPRGDTPVADYISATINGNEIVLFMKGSPDSPQCGFSATAAGILKSYGRPLAHVNVLADPDVREGVKQFSSWPTIPQVFVHGEFIGGSDILAQLHASGELRAKIEKSAP